MDFINIGKILDGKVPEGKKVAIRGWVYRERKQKDHTFLLIRDVSGIIQCTIKKGSKSWGLSRKVTVESSVEIFGEVKRDKRAPGGYEILVDKFEIVGLAERFPITKDKSEEFLRDVRHLWIRSRYLTNVFKIRSKVIQTVHEFFKSRGFYHFSPPMFVSGACEGGATLFKVKYFDKKAYLTQSWQLYAEAGIYSLEKIYTIAPSFRAEKSRTIRHLSEFWHMEVEQAWATMEDIMKVEEELLSHICHTVAKDCKKELKELKVDPKELLKIKPPFKRITYDEALKIAKDLGFKMKWGDDFGFDEEKAIAQKIGEPFFIYDYPTEAKAFYVKTYKDRPEVCMSTDLLVPKIGEISTGGARVESVDELISRMKKFGLSPKDYEWYIDLRRYGTVPHAGFGMGIERVLTWMLKLKSVFDAVPFPRTMTRVYP